MCRPFAMPALIAAVCAFVMLGTPVMAEVQSGPASTVTTSTAPEPLRGPLRINGQTYTDVKPVSSRMASLEAAANITDNNGIDEVYVKDSQGRLYVAYGYYSSTDSHAKNGFSGHMGGQMVEVVHVNNEMNTYSEIAMSGVDDLKDVFKSIINEHFPKLLTALGLGGVAIIGRQLLTSPIAGHTMATLIRAALPVMGTGLMYTAGGGALLAALWPTVIKPVINWIKKTYLDRQKDNSRTIAMVTAEDAAGLEADITITDRREGSTRENINDVLRRTDLTGTTGNAPAAARGTGTGPQGTGPRAAVSTTGTGTGTGTGATITTAGNGTPVTAVGAPILGARPNNTGGSDPFGDLRNTQ